MTHLDLFSGIGGFALAVDRVWDNVEHVFCEIDPFCQEVLKKHWPNSKIYGDIRTLTNAPTKRLYKQADKQILEGKGGSQLFTSQPRPFILTGGFPCQPFSQAGRRKGTGDNRHLWPEMLRVIREFRPRWVIGENVAGLLTIEQGLVFEQVCLDLETEGYEVQPFVIPACALNAPHRRDRVWIVANDKRYGNGRTGRIQRQGENKEKIRETSAPPFTDDSFNWNQNWIEVATRLCRVDDGIDRRFHSTIMEVYGSTNQDKMGSEEAFSKGGIVAWKELRRLWEQGKTATPSSFLYQFGLCDSLPDLSCEERPKRWVARKETAKKLRNLWEEFYALPFKEAQDMQSRLLEQIGEVQRNEAVVFKKDHKKMQELWARVYLPTGKTKDVYEELRKQTGLEKAQTYIMTASAQRNARLKSLGNAIVPQVAEEIMRAIHNY